MGARFLSNQGRRLSLEDLLLEDVICYLWKGNCRVTKGYFVFYRTRPRGGREEGTGMSFWEPIDILVDPKEREWTTRRVKELMVATQFRDGQFLCGCCKVTDRHKKNHGVLLSWISFLMKNLFLLKIYIASSQHSTYYVEYFSFVPSFMLRRMLLHGSVLYLVYYVSSDANHRDAKATQLKISKSNKTLYEEIWFIGMLECTIGLLWLWYCS